MFLIGLNADSVRTCRGCGCDDNHACEGDDGPCRWVLYDLTAPTGVCSVCAAFVGFDPAELIVMGMEQPEPLPGALLHGLCR